VGLPSQVLGDGRILQIACFFGYHIGTDDWQYRYMRGGCSYVCRTKQARNTHALWSISWYD